MILNNNRHTLIFLSFIEGGAVMVCELISAKMLAPFFGTSLTVWAAVLGLTLGGLTSGYYLGGLLSKKFGKNQTILYSVLIAAGLLLILMPFLGNWIMPIMLDFSLEVGALISLLIFMVPPLVFMGMVSPLIINLLTQDANNAGNSAGNVYAISTIGGIIATFLLGFYIIPKFGLQGPSIFAGICLMAIPLYYILKDRLRQGLLFSTLLLISVLASINSGIRYKDEFKVLYQSDGILGQVKVVDHPSYDISMDAREGRALIVNNTLQTFVDKNYDFEYSLWSWANYFPTAASIFPEGSKVLLLGLGGGTLVKQLNRLGFEVDVVEIDQRIWEVSLKYFNLNPSLANIHIDDARHYIKTCKKEYDIIIFDTFLSESVPEHLLTLEGIDDAYKILKPDGMIMSNFYGAIEGPLGKGARSVFKTFQQKSKYIKVLATPGNEISRNLIFLASNMNLDFGNIRYKSPVFEPIENLPASFIHMDQINLEDAHLLIDEKPILSKLYMPIALKWKESYNAYYKKYFLKN